MEINYSVLYNIRKIYFISSYGRVFSISHNRFLSKEITNSGYERVNLITIENANKCKHYSVHRLVLEAFNPVENMNNLFVNHIDGNKLNNTIYNLEWVSADQNMDHAIRNKLVNWKFGDECSWSSITNIEADKIGEMLSMQIYSYEYIADFVNCNKSIVRNIVNGISWRNIYEKYNLWKIHISKKRTSNFSEFQINNIIIPFIISNIYNYQDYRILCMDICKILGIKMNRSIYIELMDIIYYQTNNKSRF